MLKSGTQGHFNNYNFSLTTLFFVSFCALRQKDNHNQRNQLMKKNLMLDAWGAGSGPRAIGCRPLV